jgi:predicted ATPase/class 3 adenylate cyclase
MPELLTGTVTFLFSDIEGSTRLLRSQGDAWSALLERHHQLMRAAFSANGGQEVGTEGDSFFAAFPTAPGAVSAAVEAQRALAVEPWPPGAEIRVRIGMHTGEASFSAKTYVGLHVHRASRIASVGHGGQVLISSATRSLIQALPEGVDVRDLGEHRLKDLEQPERLWQLVIADLPSDFPPISSLDATPNNLPTRLTTFLGREREIGEIGELLVDHRLVTLTGPGGTGKTRLSLEVVTGALGHYPDGVYFVELASITDPALVPSTIAQALSLPDRGGRTMMERLVDHIGERRILVVLDNFEQVLGAAASVNDLLRACPNLALLVSSRSALHVSGEQEYPVPPLGVPDPAHLPSLTMLSQYDAVALFIERARAVKPAFEVTNENAPAVAEICVRLDGLPLAIELAAARIRVLTPQAMLARIGDRLALLSGGSRDLPERQQTLRGAIAWSHDMLDESDRALFAGLSVFVGSAGLDAIESVCGDEVSGELLDAVQSLVEKSLLRQTEGVGGDPRFAMLETIREFALDQAMEQGSMERLRRKHAGFFASVAQSAAPRLMASDKREWLDRLEEDHDNLRAAMAWALDRAEADTTMRTAFALWRFWQMRGYLAEGLERVEQALALPNSRDHPEARADALSAAAGLAYWLADIDTSRERYREEIAAREEIGDRAGLAEAHYGISFTWSILELSEGDAPASAQRHINEALAIFRDIGNRSGVGRCEWALANVLWGIGKYEAAREHGLEAHAVFESIDDSFMVGWSSYTLGLAALSDDQMSGGSPEARAEARRRLARALRIFAEAQDVTAYTLVLDGFAILALRDGDRDRAARLSGAVSRLERATGTGLNMWNRASLDFDPEDLRRDEGLAEAFAAGETLSDAEAVDYALEGCDI